MKRFLLLCAFMGACQAGVVVTVKCADQPSLASSDYGECIEGMQPLMAAASGQGTATQAMISANAIFNLYPSDDSIFAYSTVEVTDQLRFHGSGSATLRIQYSVTRGGYDLDADERISFGSKSTDPIFSTIGGVYDIKADFPIVLGQDLPYKLGLYGFAAASSATGSGNMYNTVYVSSIHLYNAAGQPILPAYNSAEGWLYPLELATDIGPIIAATPEPSTFLMAALFLLSAHLKRNRRLLHRAVNLCRMAGA